MDPCLVVDVDSVQLVRVRKEGTASSALKADYEKLLTNFRKDRRVLSWFWFWGSNVVCSLALKQYRIE